MKSFVTIIAATTVLVACGKASETVPVTAPVVETPAVPASSVSAVPAAPAASETASQPTKS